MSAEEPGFRILIVDDFEMSRKVLRQCLKRLGYRDVEEAGDGRQGYEKMLHAHEAGRPYSFVLSDISRPDRAGLALLADCKANQDLRKTPFLMIGVENARSSANESLDLGATDYLIKPFTTKMILEKIAVLTGKGARKAA